MRIPTSGSKTKYDAECGTLVVPENWEVAGSRPLMIPGTLIGSRLQQNLTPKVSVKS